jgi:hypothetical protein
MSQEQKQQMIDALVTTALLESKEIAVRFAEIIAYLQKGQHLAALGTLQGLEEQFEFVNSVLKVAARVKQKQTEE